ncbi:ARM repeat-containing protein [Auriscalpium vulgare]|uniref:ARM repeat-containing protein n=1 Tax=Auriscalpium vulgare TaxID=40419 RepID=A0ACB8R9J6_9AGAM|nr:ARM repeat-containing protein [Auriscalpium vulgare]
MRKRVSQKSGDLWQQVAQGDREQIKTKLPDLVLAETNSLVRHSTARVIAAIAGIEVPVGGWPQLLPYLHQTATSPQVAHREVGVYILYTVLETIVDGFQDQLPTFFKLFEQLLQDPESAEVRITSVRALGTIAQYIDGEDKDDIKSFQALLPGMIHVIAQTLDAGDEASARQLFDVFETLLILVRFTAASSSCHPLKHPAGNPSSQPPYTRTRPVPSPMWWEPQLRRRASCPRAERAELDYPVVSSTFVKSRAPF